MLTPLPDSVVVAHRDARNLSDRAALAAVRVLRWGLDLATGYKHAKEKARVQAGGKPFAMNEKKSVSFAFLSVAVY